MDHMWYANRGLIMYTSGMHYDNHYKWMYVALLYTCDGQVDT